MAKEAVVKEAVSVVCGARERVGRVHLAQQPHRRRRPSAPRVRVYGEIVLRRHEARTRDFELQAAPSCPCWRFEP